MISRRASSMNHMNPLGPPDSDSTQPGEHHHSFGRSKDAGVPHRCWHRGAGQNCGLRVVSLRISTDFTPYCFAPGGNHPQHGWYLCHIRVDLCWCRFPAVLKEREKDIEVRCDRYDCNDVFLCLNESISRQMNIQTCKYSTIQYIQITCQIEVFVFVHIVSSRANPLDALAKK